MTTVQKLIDNHLTCVICSDLFTKPATLQCHHTFCRPCVTKYTKTQPQAIQAKSIPCPVCRQLSRVTSPEAPVHEWANQVMPSQAIQRLLGVFGPGTQDGRTCSVCHVERERTPATSWCSDCQAEFCDSCLRYHRRMPLSRHHEVFGLLEEVELTTKRDLMCSKHTDEPIYHFCTDCMTALCTICLSMYHNLCENVLVIKDAVSDETAKNESAKGITYSGETDRTSSVNYQTEYPADDSDRTEYLIKSTCNNAIDVILEREKELIREVNSIRKDQTKALEVEIDAKVSAIGNLQEKLQIIDEALSTGCVKEMFDMFESPDLDNDEQTDSFVPVVPRFKSVSDNLKAIIAEVNICETPVATGYQANDWAALHDSVDIRHDQDKDDPCLTDVAVLTLGGVKRILVTDWNNKNIKSVFQDDAGQHLTTLQFGESPFGIAKFDPRHVMVSVPSGRKIWKVSVEPRLFVSSMISTKHRYYGIACLNDKKIVACTDIRTNLFRHSSSVDIVDMGGTVLQSIRSRTIPSPAFVSPASGSNILVSDMKSKSLTALSLRGKTLFTYKPCKSRALACPRGVSVDSNGDIFLVDGDSNKVIQLSKTGDYLRDLLTLADGLDEPSGICIDDEGMMYITSGHYVKVFRFL